jgi:hypothetical protein
VEADEVLALAPTGGKPQYANRLAATRALALARIAKSEPSQLALARRTAAEAEPGIDAMFKENNSSPLSQGDAAIYLAAAFHALGANDQAKAWQNRALKAFSASMDAAQSKRRAQAWVGPF